MVALDSFLNTGSQCQAWATAAHVQRFRANKSAASKVGAGGDPRVDGQHAATEQHSAAHQGVRRHMQASEFHVRRFAVKRRAKIGPFGGILLAPRARMMALDCVFCGRRTSPAHHPAEGSEGGLASASDAKAEAAGTHAHPGAKGKQGRRQHGGRQRQPGLVVASALQWSGIRRLIRPLAALCGLALAMQPASSLGHEVPATAQVRLLMEVQERPDGPKAKLLVRAPLEAMRDIEFPQFGAGYLDIAAAEPQLRDAALRWLAPALRLDAAGRPTPPVLTAVRASLPSSRAFADHQTAAAHLAAPPLDNSVAVPWRQAWLDAAFAYQPAPAPLTLTPRLAGLGRSTNISLTVLWPDGRQTAFTFSANPGPLRLAPAWHEAMADFFLRGMRQLLHSHDQLLLLFCLLVAWGGASASRSGKQEAAISNGRGLVALVACFAAGHSLALTSITLGLAPLSHWFGALIHALAAASILLAATANFVNASTGWRWGMAFGFALPQGVDLAAELAEPLQFAGAHPQLAVGAFNLGLVVGLVALMAPAACLWRWLATRGPAKLMKIGLSLLLAHAAWHGFAERAQTWLRHPAPWANWGVAELAGAMRWALFALLAVACYILLRSLFKRWLAP